MKLILTLSLTVAGHSALAQVGTKHGLTLDGARRVIASAQVEGRKLSAPGGVVAVVDEGGNLMVLERLDGTFAAGANISIGKARTAVLFKKPTKVFEDAIKNGRTSMVALNDFTPLQGGVPITYAGKVIGAIGVSGNNPPKDEEIALAGVNALGVAGSVSGAAAPAVSYWGKDAVAAAFSKGAVLYDGDNGARNYMVHTSRREKPGQAEVHQLDTDIIYVTGGSAKVITGGTVVDGKTTDSNELRGSAIQGGDTRTLSKGDVLIVPQGTPHWFEQVSGPLTYYVVKVR